MSAAVRVFTLIAILALASTAPLGAQNASPYTFGVILSLTGPAASIGQDEAAALVAYEKVVSRSGGINGQAVHFQIYDDESQPQVAVQLANTLLAQHPLAVFGSSLAGTTQAMIPLFKNGPILYASTPVIYPDSGSNVFAAGVSSRYTTAAVMRYFRLKGITRLAMIVTNDASGQDYTRLTEFALGLPENKTMSLVDRESFTPTDISVASQISKIKASNPQALLVWATGAPFGTVLQAMHESGLSIPIDTTGPNLNPVLLQRFKAYLPTSEMVIGGASFFKRDRAANDPLKVPIDEFYKALGAAGIKPTASHEFTWDPARIVVSTLRKLGPSATAAQLGEAIAQLHDFPGVGGMYDFRSGDQHGLTQDSIVVIRYDAGAANGQGLIVSEQGGAPLRGR